MITKTFIGFFLFKQSSMNERAINSRLKVTLQRIHENLIAEPEPEMEGHHQLVSFVCKSQVLYHTFINLTIGPDKQFFSVKL